MPSSGHQGSNRVVETAVASPWAIVGLIVVGAVLRLAVASQDLYADELATYWVVTAHGFTGVVETVATTAEITPPLSFLLTWAATHLGQSPELVRLPALLAGLASIPLVYAVGLRTVGRRAALLAATLTTLSPFMIFYSAEARGYAVLTALVLATTICLLRAVANGGWWWVGYGACVCLAMYTHYTGIFVLAVQLAWVWVVHPRARRPLLISTGAAMVLFLPWLPSLRGDLDSPTTEILSAFYPLSVETVRLNLGHWSVGFPFALPTTSLRDLPGLVPLLMLAVGVGLGAGAVIVRRARVEEWDGVEGRGGVGLMALLALATPVGALLQSAVGTNVFAVRTLAASWPYLALVVSAALIATRPPLRVAASGLVVAACAVGSLTILSADFQRPDFEELARFADDHPGAVIVNGAAFTPGPLTNFEVEGSGTDAPILRLNVPEQMTSPFTLIEERPVPAEVAERAVAEADGGRIIVISGVPPQAEVVDFLEHLPPGYEATEVKEIGGLFKVQAVVYERDASG